MARWQRERRQQTIITIVFSAILVFALALVVWAAADRYFEANLRGAAAVDGRVIPMRDYKRELAFQHTRFYVTNGIPPQFEEHQELVRDKAEYEPIALDRVMEQAILDAEARAAGVTVSEEQIDEAYRIEYGQYTVRHILVGIPEDTAEDEREAVELFAAAKARGITARLRAAPMDQALWNQLAQELSDDPGSKFSGGELGTVGKGQFVPEFEDAAQHLPVGAISDPVKTQFGYHVIQVKSRVPPQESELVRRLLASGFSEDDIRAQVRWVALRQELTRRVQEAALVSPTVQIRLARIVINTPSPSSGDVEGLIEALRKVGEVGEKLREGVDFAELALEYSDDASTKESGGEMGWVARGMLTDLRAEDAVFALAEGERTEQFVTRTQTAFYKVLERDEARELTDEQRDQLRAAAYPYWLEEKKLEHRAIPLLSTVGF